MRRSTVTVLVADEQPVVRHGLQSLLGSSSGIAVVAEAATVRETVQQAVLHKPDVLVLDIELPGFRVDSTIQEILRCSPSTSIVVFTSVDGEDAVVASIRAPRRLPGCGPARRRHNAGHPGENLLLAITESASRRPVHRGLGVRLPQHQGRAAEQRALPDGDRIRGEQGHPAGGLRRPVRRWRDRQHRVPAGHRRAQELRSLRGDSQAARRLGQGQGAAQVIESWARWKFAGQIGSSSSGASGNAAC